LIGFLSGLIQFAKLVIVRIHILEMDSSYFSSLGLEFSVLVGRATVWGYIPFASTTITIMAGLIFTIHATCTSSETSLPALPIAISMGILVYLSSVTSLQPFVLALAEEGIMM
jgi:hypothetical protein